MFMFLPIVFSFSGSGKSRFTNFWFIVCRSHLLLISRFKTFLPRTRTSEDLFTFHHPESGGWVGQWEFSVISEALNPKLGGEIIKTTTAAEFSLSCFPVSILITRARLEWSVFLLRSSCFPCCQGGVMSQKSRALITFQSRVSPPALNHLFKESRSWQMSKPGF